MMSGTILLGMLVLWMNTLTSNISWVEFPILFPLIVVLQWLLVAVIQAFVFSLLTAIFIKVATEE
jgi:F0F1-type ATP synthase membrane subunit a